MDDPAAYIPTEEDLAEAREKAEQLSVAAQKLGLYAQGYEIGTASNEDDELRMVLVVQFIAGEITWTDRVLNPENADINDEFISMKTELENESFEEYRAGLAQRFKETEDE
jgi:hypothetical protein